MGIPPSQQIQVLARSNKEDVTALLKRHETILKCLNTRVSMLTIDAKLERPKSSAAAVVRGADLYVPLEGLIDFAKEKARLEKEMTALQQEAERLLKKLANQDFTTHAPKEEVDRTHARVKEAQERLEHLHGNILTLG
jgi:valyl-tRNA synthetase